MKYLFTTWFGAGNQVPEIGLAQALAGRGHQISFAGYAHQRDRFEEQGFEFRELARADAAYRFDAPPDQIMVELVRGVWASPELRLDVAELATDGFDAAVVDCLMFSALAALEDAELPTAVLVHSAPGALCPPGAPSEPFVLEPVNALREPAGLRRLDSLWQAWEPFPTLCTSVPELDPLADRVPPSFSYVGPIGEASPPSGWTAPWPDHDQRPLILVSFSTGLAWDQRPRIERTLAALGDAETYRVLVCSTMTDVDQLAVPDNAVIVRSVPHSEILPGTAVTVTHAGHGTIAASLAHGVPIVALPNPAADQPALATRVAELGAGIALDGETATPAEIADAVATVIADDSYRASARRLADRIAESPGAEGAAGIIERLPERSRAVH